MNGTPNPVNPRNLSRAGIAGLVLGILGIVLFIVLWIVLGNAGVDQLPRLLLSLCLPPAFMAGILGAYILIAHPTPPKE